MGTKAGTDDISANLASQVEKMRKQTAVMKAKRLNLPKPGALMVVVEKFASLSLISPEDEPNVHRVTSFPKGTISMVVHIDTRRAPHQRSLFEPDDSVAIMVLIDGQLWRMGPSHASILSAYEIIE